MVNKSAQFKNMTKHIRQVPEYIIREEEKLTAASPFRQKFHIEAKSGFLNDPNGFSFFNGKYHLFYQWTPLAFKQDPPIWHHGWYHIASLDLINWEDLGPAIESDTELDKHGTYSGSAIVIDDKLFCIYTGNTWTNTQTDNWRRLPYQVGAWMDEYNQFKKIDKPLIIDTFADCTGHFRDPKIWKHANDYYAILGAQRKDLTGTAKIIKSEGHDLTKWQKYGELKTGEANLGYMWECPDYFELNGQGVLLFSPQGLSPKDNYFQNVYQTGYFIGEPLNYENLDFKHGQFHELDAGFDFYASQTLEAPDGRRIMMAWFGISEMEYPTTKYHYSGCLTIPRELIVEDKKLLQRPIVELEKLRKKEKKADILIDSMTELDTTENVTQELDFEVNLGSADSFVLDLRANQDNSQHTRLIIDRKNQYCILSRKESGISFAEKYGTERKRKFKFGQNLRVHIFVDVSSVEIFIGKGEVVFSARIFPNDNQTKIFAQSIGGKSQLTGKVWDL
ncbi:glycoside hydrolase family 32 protein [Liquorilactobacillus mali]|nr:sucrose-6-phosphate hydrolase [Liquorilactobacillus mali]EJE99706.1 sucrose-6-phosphate hydrolase [Liquorilactobacillus mali KCTC 3596 = DSM 20444]MDC7953479.1 sucrose-6-phosphate hydrolase [Liquorilactobacillus mali]QFQ73874.1 sucrose-6-phosphate hydrolase [Liquorilactobacillus mali]